MSRPHHVLVTSPSHPRSCPSHGSASWRHWQEAKGDGDGDGEDSDGEEEEEEED